MSRMVNRLRDDRAADGTAVRGAAQAPLVLSGRPVLTTSAAEILAAEISRLRAPKDLEFRKRRRDALSVSAGDEDAQLAIGEDELVIEARIANLSTLLHHAKLIDHDPGGEDIVTLGS